MRNKIISITSYPPKDTLYGKKVGGLASYAKNTIKAMKNTSFIVLAQELPDNPRKYKEGKDTVIRCWEVNKISQHFQFIKNSLKYKDKTNRILVEFELKSFGDPFVTGFFPFTLFVLKLLGFKINIVIHQVLTNLKKLSPHLGENPDSLKVKIENILMQFVYKLVCLPATKIIVMDEIHRKNLARHTNIEKVHVIPHGVDTEISKKAHKKLPQMLEDSDKFQGGRFTLMIFGFVNWYKGSDWLLNSYKTILSRHPQFKENTQLVIAGGPNPTQRNNPVYDNFYSDMKKTAENTPNTVLTGFVDEKDIGAYFHHADIILLPYRVLMSSSGPLSLAVSYAKPFLLSDNLKPYIETADFKKSLEQNQLNPSQIVFALQPEALLNKLNTFINNRVYGEKLKNISKDLKDSRSWQATGKKYENIMN